MGDLRCERPPAVFGHVINVPTHVNVKLPEIDRHLPNADTDSHLLVVRTCYNGQYKQMPHFRWSFHPKIVGAHPKLRLADRQFAQISMLPSGDCKQYFISSVNACVMNHVVEANQPPLVTFVLRHHVVKVRYSVFNPRCRRRERFLRLTSECCRAGAAKRKQHVSKQTEWPSWPSGIPAAGLL